MQRYKYYIGRSDTMKKFVDRFQELETLKNEYNSNSSSFVCFMAEEESEKRNS